MVDMDAPDSAVRSIFLAAGKVGEAGYRMSAFDLLLLCVASVFTGVCVGWILAMDRIYSAVKAEREACANLIERLLSIKNNHWADLMLRERPAGVGHLIAQKIRERK